jgi:hypothetical protein
MKSIVHGTLPSVAWIDKAHQVDDSLMEDCACFEDSVHQARALLTTRRQMRRG